MEYVPFIVQVDSSEIRVETTRHKKIYTEDLRLKKQDIELLEVLEKNIVKGGFGSYEALRAYGSLLYRTLFLGDIHGAFQIERSKLAADQSIHIQLEFKGGDADKLGALSWEYLHYPETRNQPGYFFLWEPDLTISRLVSMSEPRPDNLIPASSVVNIWVIVAPPNLKPLSDIVRGPQAGEPEYGMVLWEQTVNHVKLLRNRINKARPGSVKVRVFDHPTLNHLLEHEFIEADEESENKQVGDVAQGQGSRVEHPDVLHIISHGRVSEGNAGEVGLVGINEIAWCKDYQFVELVNDLGGRPRLILLQQCETGRSTFVNGFRGVALRLGMEVSPAVIAMQHEIFNDDAIDFSEHFYFELFRSGNVLAALQAGRGRLQLTSRNREDRRTFGTPVLQMYSLDGQFFETPPGTFADVPEPAGANAAARAAVSVVRSGNGAQADHHLGIGSAPAGTPPDIIDNVPAGTMGTHHDISNPLTDPPKPPAKEGWEIVAGRQGRQ